MKRKTALITGASRGIGRAIATAFARAGCNIVITCSKSEQELLELQTELKTKYAVDVLASIGDISDYQYVEHLFFHIAERFHGVDILINNVGISKFSSITETSVEDFDKILSVNLRPVFITSRLFAIHRKGQSDSNPYGRIINICSTRYLMSEPGSEGYAASKGGIYSLTHALALSLSEWNITVNSIAPGWIQTQDYDQLRPEDHSQHPSRRVGKPEDIARMCLFLCRDENDFINGENITIDGGMTKKMIYTE